MKSRRIALPLIAAALGSIATAASADIIYRDAYVRGEPVQVTRVETQGDAQVVSDRYVVYTAPETPRLVERYVAPREMVVIERDPIVVTEPRYYANGNWDPRNPQRGQLLDRGLFNRQGPNDFGR